MSLTGSFDNGVAALMAQSQAMGTISQNIANLRTAGYKRADTGFETLLGGIEVSPYAPGGVRAEISRRVSIQGGIEQNDRPLDLALNGKGFFVYSSEATGAGDISYSRNAPLFPGHVEDDGVGFLTGFEDLYLMAWEVDASGAVAGDDLADMVAIPATFAENFSGRATTTGTLSAIIPATGTTASTQIFYFDSAGAQQSVQLTWTKTGINTWDLQPEDLAGAPLGAPTTMIFDGDGNVVSGASVDVGGLFTLDTSGVTQRGNLFFKDRYTQDGLGAGSFTNYSVDEDGIVSAHFSSGAVETVFQLPLANFANPDGLLEQSRNLWLVSAESGHGWVERRHQLGNTERDRRG